MGHSLTHYLCKLLRKCTKFNHSITGQYLLTECEAETSRSHHHGAAGTSTLGTWKQDQSGSQLKPCFNASAWHALKSDHLWSVESFDFALKETWLEENLDLIVLSKIHPDTEKKRPWSHGSQRSAVHQDESVSPWTNIESSSDKYYIILHINTYYISWCQQHQIFILLQVRIVSLMLRFFSSSWASRTLAATKWLLAIPSTWSSQNLLETQRPPQLFPCQYKKRQEMMRKFTW